MAETTSLHFLRDNWHILSFMGAVVWYMAQQSSELKKIVKEFADYVKEQKDERSKLGECVDDHETRLSIIEDRDRIPRRRRNEAHGPRP